MNERALIGRLESANAEELIELFRNATVEEEKVLRIYLGEDRFRHMRHRAIAMPTSRGPRSTHAKGNVVVIPGIMGSTLTSVARTGDLQSIWLNPLQIMMGRFGRLHLDRNGLAEDDDQYDVRPAGILKTIYGELLLSLAANWNVRAFWYDWRKDLRVAAAELDASIRGWFGENEPVKIVAHSMGGLVARTYIQERPNRWKDGSRLVMLGTPNHGAFEMLEVVTGSAAALRYLALVDQVHEREDLIGIVNSFPGIYQLLPSPFALREAEALYDPGFYPAPFQVSATHLENAKLHHAVLRKGPFDRMVLVAGCNRATTTGVDVGRLRACLHRQSSLPELLDCFQVGMKGDGAVPHSLSALEGVRNYYVEDSHNGLLLNSQLLGALDSLLEHGQARLSESIPATRGDGPLLAKERLEEQRRHDEEVLEHSLHQLQRRGGEMVESPAVSSYERDVADILVRGLLSDGSDARPALPPEPSFAPPTIQVNLVSGDIAELDRLELTGGPVDAIAVGLYLNDMPSGPVLALDEVISASQPPTAGVAGSAAGSNLLLTGLAARGALRGERGQPFFLTDPRPTSAGPGRLIAVTGLGAPGQLGGPELVVIVRELCWSLGWVGRRHVAAPLIGAGQGNLSVREAVSAWMRGVKNALTGLPAENQRHVITLTFVEKDADRIKEIEAALVHEQQLYASRNRLIIKYDKILKMPPPKQGVKNGSHKRERDSGVRPDGENEGLRANRISISRSGQTYTFGALTDGASIPERSYPIDSGLVEQVNNDLASELDTERQLELGQFMAQLIIPKELRPEFGSSTSLVLILDASTARLHWELMVPPDSENRDAADLFLGISRGLTRQLRTAFAPSPQPMPAAQRRIRVLLVSNPDGSLPWAEEEGAQLARLFESYNTVCASTGNQIEVVTLFGAHEATRSNVLRSIMTRTFDLLHFSGHCAYVEDDRLASGWKFANGETLTANELTRVDRVPQFVFSNACESGITPDRAGERSVDLAPVFAETFFAQGVSNLVCTAWPVEDAAACRFAIEVYARLLGMVAPKDLATDGDGYLPSPEGPQPMHVAMRDARRALLDRNNPSPTWGAYQHYGPPFFRLLSASTSRSEGRL